MAWVGGQQRRCQILSFQKGRKKRWVLRNLKGSRYGRLHLTHPAPDAPDATRNQLTRISAIDTQRATDRIEIGS